MSHLLLQNTFLMKIKDRFTRLNMFLAFLCEVVIVASSINAASY